jgi:hypothetical protein
LLSAVTHLQDGARDLVKTELFEAEAVLTVVRPVASRSVEALARQVQTARSLFYDAPNASQNARALELVDQALLELERASPLARPWPVISDALVLQALLFQAQQLRGAPTREPAEPFRKLLRVDPSYRLDPDSFAPSFVQALEVVRKEVQRKRGAVLQISSAPLGAQVFLDGREMGKTPFKQELARGEYRVSLVLGEGLSFPHRVTVGRDGPLVVDMAFEGGVAQQSPLCVNSSDDDGLALRLAATVSIEQTIVVRNTASKGDPAYITGALYDARGERTRNAGVRPEQLRDLMLYLFTGKPDPPFPPPQLPLPTAEVAAPRPQALQSSSFLPANSSGFRVASAVSLGLGVALLASGAVTSLSGIAEREALTAERQANQNRLPRDPTGSLGRLDAIAANEALSFGLIGLGVGTAVAGIVGLVLFPAPKVQVAVAPALRAGSTGASISLAGAF